MTIKKTMIALATVAVAGLSANAGVGDMPTGNLYVWKDGRVVYMTATANVADVRVSDDKSTLSFVDSNSNVLYSAPKANIDSIGFYSVPARADLLDVVFNADGSATDVSPRHAAIEHPSSTNQAVYWNSTYSRFVAHSSCGWGAKATGHYRISVADDAFFNRLKDGYTMEAIVMTPEKGSTDEAKFISCHQSGGPGAFMISNDNKLTFLPNTSTTGYCWGAQTDYNPNTYYHVVGVYSRTDQKAYLYVNGELKGTAYAPGELTHPSSTAAYWFSIFGDPAGNNQQQSMPGDVVLFRLYDNPLNSNEVKILWDNTPHAPTNLPVADLLDVAFLPNGTAIDISPSKRTVEQKWTNTLSTYFNGSANRYMAHSTAAWNAANTGHYRISIAEDAFFNRLKDGYTMEAVLMSPQKQSAEAKWIACHQGGGPGAIMVAGDGRLTFLPHTSTTGYCWGAQTDYNIDTYYHVVGVYSKTDQKAYLYVNGKLAGTATAVGELTRPSDTNSYWFAIFGDPQSGNLNQAIPGDIGMFRLYDAVLNAGQISNLYKNWLGADREGYAEMITNVSYVSNVPVKQRGGRLAIDGKGFTASDIVQLVSTLDDTKAFSPAVELTSTGVVLTLPDNFQSGSYNIVVARSSNKQMIGAVTLTAQASVNKTEVIAHRGYWNKVGSAQNSRASLKFAQELGVYGSETDIWITTDGKLMVNHDPSFNGVTIQTSTYAKCKDLTLSNGEKMPTLDDLLTILKNSSSPTKLIIEVKSHSTTARTQEAAAAAVNLVKQYGLQNKVEYIAFSWDACTKIKSVDSSAKVAYLNGDKTPQQVKDAGLTGIDYEIGKMRSNSSWFAAARNLGITVNVWTLRSVSDIVEMINRGADYLTTDMPLDAMQYKRHYDLNQ